MTMITPVLLTAIFWVSAGLIAYVYFGYPAFLWLRSCWRRREVPRAPFFPFISIVMVVRNEAQILERKLKNLLLLDYPADLVHLILVSDGSTDRTGTILHKYASHPRIDVLLNQLPRGKVFGLNDALLLARGDIVVFTDARQEIEPGAVSLLLENFAASQVGCASGELMLGDPQTGEVSGGMGVYWRIEKRIRELESVSGSVVGATGALYAIRRNLLSPLPEQTILDDVYWPMQVVRQGFRVVFDARARAWDRADFIFYHEFARKVRTLGGNYQLLELAPWLLTRANPIRFEFVSHKLLRLLVPFALVGILAISLLIRAPFYRLLLVLQAVFYGLSILSLARLKLGPMARVADVAFTFVMLNAAALVSFVNFISGRKVAWLR
jgi:cellulose synthase/poly-beta-1,6-N-acetylglucosamine synthase-like glycosyltransferase